jgi:CBS domain-containing protein
MRLADLLAADRTIVPLEADTLPAAADALIARLVAAGGVGDLDKLRRRVAEERPEDMVGMGDRAFLLHYRTDAVPELRVALGTSPRPICRELGDDEEQCARILLLVVAPPRLAARYLQVVGAFARFLASAERVDALLQHASADALVADPRLADYAVPEQLTVRDLMTERPRSVAADTPLRDAARFLVRARVGGMPVVDDDGYVLGMLSERELMQHLLTAYLQGGAPRPEPPTGALGNTRRSVRDVMTRQVLCVSPDQPLAEAASLMNNRNVDRVPVVKEGRLVGFLTRGDIVRKLIGF